MRVIIANNKTSGLEHVLEPPQARTLRFSGWDDGSASASFLTRFSASFRGEYPVQVDLTADDIRAALEASIVADLTQRIRLLEQQQAAARHSLTP